MAVDENTKAAFLAFLDLWAYRTVVSDDPQDPLDIRGFANMAF
jgi:hypothetical protein